MAKIIPKTVIEDIRSKSDVVDVIGSYINLKRTGTTHKALCPFHKEKTPSFHVNPQRQSFHCFGCDKGGDVFRFVMEYEGVDFVTSVRLLAQRCGVMLELENDDGRGADKKLLYEVLDEAAKFYHRLLMDENHGAEAQKYLSDRQLDGDICKDFLFGYSLDRFDTLQRWAEKKGYKLDLLERAGLLGRSENGRLYDRFRGRLMIPIRDELGRVIAFTARNLRADQGGGKYVNSPETMLFHKNRVLFGIDRARRAIASAHHALLCEGQIDAIRCHQVGILEMVASQGTAITENHARLVRRYADRVTLVLDGDPAGQNAAMKSCVVFFAAGLEVRVATLPDGNDPDSMILDQGPDVFRALLERAVPLIDFQINLLKAQGGLDSEADIKRTATTLLETVSEAPSQVIQDQLITHIARNLVIDDIHLRAEFKQLEFRQSNRNRFIREEEQPVTPKIKPAPPEEFALAELLLQHPSCVELVESYIAPSHLQDEDCRLIIDLIIDHKDDPNWNLAQDIPPDNERLVRLTSRMEVSLRHATSGNTEPAEYVRELIMRIRRSDMERRRLDMRRKMDQLSADERTLYSRLTVDINTLHRNRWQEADSILQI